MSKGRPAQVLGFCCQINTGKVEYLAVHPALCGEMCNENFESSLRLKEDLKESSKHLWCLSEKQYRSMYVRGDCWSLALCPSNCSGRVYGWVYEWVQIVRKHNIHYCCGSHEYQNCPLSSFWFFISLLNQAERKKENGRKVRSLQYFVIAQQHREACMSPVDLNTWSTSVMFVWIHTDLFQKQQFVQKKKNCILLPFSQWAELRAVLGFHFPCLIYNLTVRATFARKVTFREVYLENMK